MKQKNNTIKILIIAVAVSIIVLIGIIAFLLLGTNIFKSDKQNFFKYTIQMVNSKSGGLIDNKTIEYFEKKKNSSYQNKGSISFKYDSEKDKEQYENINKLTISFSRRSR